MLATIRLALARPAREVLLTLAVLTLAVGNAGCGKVGCFEYTEIEYEEAGGTCPSQEEALAYFGGMDCDSEVESVDSEGEYDGYYCCYEITKRTNRDDISCGF